MTTKKDTSILLGKVSRINWGAIIAGAVLAVSVSILLNLLGVSVGFSAINPLYESSPLNGIGTGSLVWIVISNLIAIFSGAWVAGRFAGFVNNRDGGLHGVMTWALYLLASFIFLTSTVSGIISGVGNKVSSVFGNNNTQKVIIQSENQTNTNQQTSFNDIKNDVITYLTKAEDLNLIPETISQETKEKIRNSGVDVNQMIRELHLDEKLSHYISGLEYNIDNDGKITFKANNDFIAADDVSVKEYLVNNTELTEEEINDLSQNLSREVNKITVKAEQYANEAIQKSKEYAQKATDMLADIALYSFLAFLLGLIVSYFAGSLASPKNTVEAVEDNN